MELILQAIRNGRLDDALADELSKKRFESMLWDYKEIMLLDAAGKAELARDCTAFHNTDGGYILVGVKDKTWKVLGVEESILRAIDQTQINNAIHSYVGERFSVTYRICRINGCPQPLGLIYIPPRQGRPVIIQSNGPQVGRDLYFRQGDIFVRIGDSSKRVTNDIQFEQLWNKETTLITSNSDSTGWEIVEYGFRLPPKPEPLVGREEYKERVLQSLDSKNRWWITSIEGLGGVGKTALASEIVWELYKSNRFESIISVTAKNRELTPSKIMPLKPELVGIDSVVDAVLEANGFSEELKLPLNERIEVVKQLLEMTESLIFLDNLETVDDSRVFEFLKNLPNPTRALVTSRRQPETGEDRIKLEGLNTTNSRVLVNKLIEEYQIPYTVDEHDRDRVTKISGGLPLAIIWLIGQIRLQNSTAFLSNINGEVPEIPEQILEFSFRNMFNLLSDDQRLILKLSALVPDESFNLEQYMHLTEWGRDRTNKAINGLVQSSFFIRNESETGSTFTVLPITASFAYQELMSMGDYVTTVRTKLREMQYRQRDANTIVDYLQSLFHGRNEAEQLAVGLAKAAAEEYAAGNYEKGREFFEQAEAYYDKSPYLFYTRATSELNAGNSGHAYVYFDRATRLIERPTSKDSVVWKIWGQALKQEGNWREAVDKLAIALSLNEKDPYCLHMMAFCQSKLGQYPAADKYYTRALEIIEQNNPKQKQLTLTSQAQNLYQWGRDLDRALELTYQIEKLPGSKRRIHSLRADIQRKIKANNSSY
ncbi:Flp pilus assembly protein TadD, contains TPR repeats [Paenibacillus sp. 1_12]|uniref:RNA-binding domain-containing protein n=1 Tax=Paenibacillus sp. 1_12 TaxID=1566278 RepID=UPI0008E5D182|nr:RNA-binding domain-containing protein [Paenibacillus sp. 1_12]SFM25674.1 Flp pilus assembly protein TadD, contains TPR repeats [Paenibacillus sp. 1_12]